MREFLQTLKADDTVVILRRPKSPSDRSRLTDVLIVHVHGVTASFFRSRGTVSPKLNFYPDDSGHFTALRFNQVSNGNTEINFL